MAETNQSLTSIESSMYSHPQTSPTASREWRRLRLYQSKNLFAQDHSGATYTRATTLAELRQAYRLVHDVFVEKGFIEPDSQGLRIRPYELSPSTATYVAKVRGVIVGVTSVIEDSDQLGLPSDSIFEKEHANLRSGGKRLCEISNQAIAVSFRNTAVCTELIRCLIAHAWIFQIDYLVASISPNQYTFYQIMGFKKIGAVRSYSPIGNDPVISIIWPLSEAKERWQNEGIDSGTLNAFWKNFFLINNPNLPFIPAWQRRAQTTFQQTDISHRLLPH